MVAGIATARALSAFAQAGWRDGINRRIDSDSDVWPCGTALTVVLHS
jgi:hypothetical protein